MLLKSRNLLLSLVQSVQRQFSDIAELQTTDGSLGWMSRGELGNRSTIKNYRLQGPDDVIKLHNLFHHRQHIEKTSGRSSIGSWKSKNGKVVSWNTGNIAISRKQWCVFWSGAIKSGKIDSLKKHLFSKKREHRTTGHWSNTSIFKDCHQNLWRIIHPMNVRIFD